MPLHERLGRDDREDFQDRWKSAIQLNKEQAIVVREPDAPVRHVAQHNQLVTESGILSFKLALRLEWRPIVGQYET